VKDKKVLLLDMDPQQKILPVCGLSLIKGFKLCGLLDVMKASQRCFQGKDIGKDDVLCRYGDGHTERYSA